ncbi:MAG: DUF4352 domain-containing protein [Candidatus Delongbacteria bacterium]
MKHIIKIMILIFVFLSVLSCGESADELISRGEYDEAIVILKHDLSKDYENTKLRNKITKLYFTNAKKNIRENKLKEAERDLERGIIYSDENDPDTKDEYAEILVLLGSNLIGSGDRDGSVEQKKKYEKGLSLIERSIPLTENDQKARSILNTIKAEEAETYFDLSKEYYDMWLNDKNNLELLNESKKYLDQSKDIAVLKNTEDMENTLTGAYLTQNIKNRPYDIKLTTSYFNSDTGYIALKIRFYNNSDKNVVISPNQFTLYDTEKNEYKHSKTAAVRGNFKGILRNFMINPGRFLTGLLVFDTDIHRNPVLYKIEWEDKNKNRAEKKFPKIPITELDLQ